MTSVEGQPDVPLARGDTRTKLTPRSWEWSILGGSGRVVNSLDFCPASLKGQVQGYSG